MDAEPEREQQPEHRPTQTSGATRGTGTTLAVGCVVLFILLTIALAFFAQQFR